MQRNAIVVFALIDGKDAESKLIADPQVVFGASFFSFEIRSFQTLFSGIDRFKRQFAHLEEHYGKGERGSPLLRQHTSLPRERVPAPKDDTEVNNFEMRTSISVATTLHSPPREDEDPVNVNGVAQNGQNKANYSARSLLKSASISASKCIGARDKREREGEPITEQNEEIDGLSKEVAALHA